MSKKKIAAIALFVLAMAGIGITFSDDLFGPNEEAAHASGPAPASWRDSPFQTSAEHYLSSYIVDKNHQIPFKDTGMNGSSVEPEQQQKDAMVTRLVNRGTAEYFRFLQTQFNGGSTLLQNIESIHAHLLATLPKDDAEKLFALYGKFVDFELSLGDKTKAWKMPESPGEALAMIGKMQQLQQQQFGKEDADLLFGGELKAMEYTARRSGILNDQIALGTTKEAMLKKLATDMFGADSEMRDEKKNPYNVFEEKLLVYKYDLEKMEPLERDKMIQALREKYLPASANNPLPNP